MLEFFAFVAFTLLFLCLVKLFAKQFVVQLDVEEAEVWQKFGDEYQLEIIHTPCDGITLHGTHKGLSVKFEYIVVEKINKRGEGGKVITREWGYHHVIHTNQPVLHNSRIEPNEAIHSSAQPITQDTEFNTRVQVHTANTEQVALLLKNDACRQAIRDLLTHYQGIQIVDGVLEYKLERSMLSAETATAQVKRMLTLAHAIHNAP